MPKRHFEINWPLGPYNSLLEYFCKIIEVYLEIEKDSSHCDLKTTLGNANCCFHPKKTTRICKKLPNFALEFSLVFRLRKKERSFPTIFFLLVNMKTLLLPSSMISDKKLRLTEFRKKWIGRLKPRTTDTQRGNSVHCTAKNSIPIPNF